MTGNAKNHELNFRGCIRPEKNRLQPIQCFLMWGQLTLDVQKHVLLEPRICVHLSLFCLAPYELLLGTIFF